MALCPKILQSDNRSNTLPLPGDASHLDLELKFNQHMEFTANGEVAKRFSWVTQFAIESSTIPKLVSGGRARWKIENETFNILKNQGYHLDHNLGHGVKNLSTVFAKLMFLAFLVVQVQQLSWPLFAKAMSQFNTKRAYLHHLRCCFESFALPAWTGLYQAIIDGQTRNQSIRFKTS